MRDAITVSGLVCAVVPVSRVGLRHYERTNSPTASVEAPEGYTFSGGETVLMIHSAADLAVIEAQESLTQD